MTEYHRYYDDGPCDYSRCDDRGEPRDDASRCDECFISRVLSFLCCNPYVVSTKSPITRYRATLRIVSHVRVVTSFPNVFSSSDMKTGPRGLGR